MTIIERIENKAHEFKMQHGRNPTRVYLGADESERLKNAVQLPVSVKPSEPLSRRPVIYGKEIFTVDADQHLQVG